MPDKRGNRSQAGTRGPSAAPTCESATPTTTPLASPHRRRQGPDPVALAARCRAAVAAVAPELLDLDAHRGTAESLAYRRPQGFTRTRSSGPRVVPSSSGFRAARPVQSPAIPGPMDEMDPIHPGRPGPYPVCISEVTLPGCKGEPMKLRAFAPGQERDRFCHPVVEGCPLVIVLNATPCPGGVGEEDYYSGYDVLATHLASYGYVVVSLGHRTPECKLSDNTGALVPHVLQWIEEGGLGLHKILSQKVTILGHSIGGRIALQGVAALKKSHAEGQLSDWSFAALVLLAPVVQLTELNDAFLAFSQGGSLLVMTVFMDTDIRTSGIEHKPPPVLRYTGVDVFEGVTGFTGAKHFLEASNGETQNEISSGDTHHFQDKLFCRAYICAFLQAYVRQLLAYKAFFREQVKVPELAPPRTIRHLHAEPPGVEHLLIDIKNSPFVQPVKGVIDWSFEESNAIDDISLSKERVVRVDFDFEQGAMIVLQATSPIGPVRPRLVLRVAQSRYVQSHGFPSRPSVDVAVSLRFFHQGEFQQTVEVRFSEVAGRRLRDPGYRPCMICNHPAGADCARQSLEDIVIPISLFAIPKGAAILAVQYHVIEEKSNERGSVLLGLVRLL